MTAQGGQDAAPGLASSHRHCGPAPPSTRAPRRPRARGPAAGGPTALLLSSPDVSHVFPEFPAPDLGSTLLQESVLPQDVRALQLAYRRHCEVTAPRAARGEPAPRPWGLGGPQCPLGPG